MGQQQISGQFPGFPVLGVSFNLQDLVSVVNPGWSSGAYLTVPVASQPPLAQVWSVVAWSIVFNGLIDQNGGLSRYGRLGRLIGGIAKNLSANIPTSATPQLPSTVGMAELPSDKSALQVIWDGTTDPIFPADTTPIIFKPTLGTMQLPVPIEVQSGEDVGIGLWLEPSLVANARIQIFDATYTLTIDDGTGPPTPGWGQG